MRIFALAFVVATAGFGLGCHGSESCRQKQEIERLTRENAELRVETTRLIKENQALAAAATEAEEDDDVVEDLVAEELPPAHHGRQARDLMDPFPQTAPPTKGETLLEQSQDAYVHGFYRKAIDLANSARGYQPSKAFRIIGASECFLKEEGAARKAYQALDKQGQQFLKYVCYRNGIEL